MQSTLTSGALMRIYIGETDRHEGRPLHEVILQAALHAGLSGATALRGFAGYGTHNRMHTTRILRLSENLPIVIEIADTDEHLAAFLPTLDKLIEEGLVTLEKIRMKVYRRGSSDT